VSEGLAQGPYMVARVGFEPVTDCVLVNDHVDQEITKHSESADSIGA